MDDHFVIHEMMNRIKIITFVFRGHRELFGRFGMKSGVDPRVAWLPKSRAREEAELDREWIPSLEDRLGRLKEQQHQIAAERAAK